MKQINLKPKWLNKYSQTPLHKKLYGEEKQYDHMIICSADRRKPIWCDLCICLKFLRKDVKC